MSAPLTGGCLCGAVRYEAKGDPVASLICHCRDCQKTTGAAAAPVLIMHKEQVEIAGEARTFETRGDSGQSVRRGFCPTCGSRLFSLADVAPTLIAVAACSLDDPSQFRPGMHVFTASAQPWDHIADGLPVFPRAPQTKSA